METLSPLTENQTQNIGDPSLQSIRGNSHHHLGLRALAESDQTPGRPKRASVLRPLRRRVICESPRSTLGPFVTSQQQSSNGPEIRGQQLSLWLRRGMMSLTAPI
jgi:hypothetical protein